MNLSIKHLIVLDYGSVMPDGRAKGRRSPTAEERQRDPERTKARILDAALSEFAAKGYAGARVSAIADRAGVNKQLISYYFGGKEGLLRAVGERWRADEVEAAPEDLSLAELVSRYVPRGEQMQALTRLLVWSGLEARADEPDPDEAARTDRLREAVADLERRQAAGELDPDLDPRAVLLALFAAAAAPAIFPQVARSIFGVDPGSAEFAGDYAAQLARLAARLEA